MGARGFLKKSSSKIGSVARDGTNRWARVNNATRRLQYLMNDIFRDVLDIYVTCYLDDMLIFSSDPADHNSHVREVLQRLIRHGLYVRAEKCNFLVTKYDLLGYQVSTSGIGLSPSNVSLCWVGNYTFRVQLW